MTDAISYCYLLGVYLGDGTVCRPRGKHVWLQVVNDRRYRSISAEILEAMRSTFPGSRPRMHPSFVGESDVLAAGPDPVLSVLSHSTDPVESPSGAFNSSPGSWI